jgi:ankyrin repeat protein
MVVTLLLLLIGRAPCRYFFHFHHQQRMSTPLHVAARKDRLAVVKLLIRHNADLNAREVGGFTPLMWASSNGRVAVASELLRAGADRHAKGDDGATALVMARKNGKHDVAVLLMNAES